MTKRDQLAASLGEIGRAITRLQAAAVTLPTDTPTLREAVDAAIHQANEAYRIADNLHDVTPKGEPAARLDVNCILVREAVLEALGRYA